MPPQPTMRAMEIRNAQLTLAQLPVPTPHAGELLIRVAFIGVNHADLLQVQGKYAPPEGASPLPGLEISGTIAALGEGVTGWNIGDHACALLSGGGYAEYVTVPAAQVLPVPANLSLREAATIPEAAATAVMALAQEANLQPGERVLVHGGTSGLGILMTQIAKAWGAEVYTTVGSDEKMTFLTPFGLHPINHRTAPFGEQIMHATGGVGIDAIIDTLGGGQLANHFKLLRRNGRMVTLAMMDGPIAESVKITGVLMKHLRWSGATLRSRSPAEKAAIMEIVRTRVWPHLASGAIRPVVDSAFPLAEAEKAFARMQERLHMGKILLEVAP